MEEFYLELKRKYNYSDDLIAFLKRAVPAIITYYGTDKKDIIYKTLINYEIHIQECEEDMSEYLNNYFNTNKTWNFPSLAGGFEKTKLMKKDNKIYSKSIIYIITKRFRKIYRPFDFSNDSDISGLIHEMCHAIKEYGKIYESGNKVIIKSGLISSEFIYNETTKEFECINERNFGIEEALNSFDEAEIMTILTGVPHESSSYVGMANTISYLMKNEKLAEVIRTSQFTGGDEWIEFLGKEKSDLLIENFDICLDILQRPISELTNESLGLMEQMNEAYSKIGDFIKSYCSESPKK